jgi:hypothetical protein
MYLSGLSESSINVDIFVFFGLAAVLATFSKNWVILTTFLVTLYDMYV